MAFLLAFKYCHQRATGHAAWQRVGLIIFQGALKIQYTVSGQSGHTVWSNPMYRRRIPLPVQWRPKTSSLYAVCWNAKCFLSSDASSISRCLIPVHAAFGALPGSIETTWLNDRRQRQSDRWRHIAIRVIGNETKNKTYSLNSLEPCQFVSDIVWTKLHIASNASIILSIYM